MKKFILSILSGFIILTGLPSFCSEIEDDYVDIAANYCILGQYDQAIEYLDKIIKLNPNNQKAIDLKKGLMHVISQDKKSFIDSANPYVKQAMEYKRAGNEQAELESLIKGTQSQNSYLANYYLGNFYRNKHQYQKALDCFNSSVSDRPDFAPAYLSIGIVLYQVGRYQSVINPIDKYLTFNPNDDLAYAIKSRAEFSLGMFIESKYDNERAISLNSTPEYLFDKAKILYKENKYSESKELFTKLLPNIQTSKIYEYLGLCDYAMGNYNSALNNYDKAIILSEDDDYLLAKYNEIKELLDRNQNEKTE